MLQDPINENQAITWLQHQAITWLNVNPDLMCHLHSRGPYSSA